MFLKAEASDRKRMNYDLRTSSGDNSQRMLNALLPGKCVPVHRHPMSTENVFCLKGKLVEVIYEEVQDVTIGKRLREKVRIVLDPSAGSFGCVVPDPSASSFGCVVPAGAWHTVEVLEPSVIYEAKDGKYGADGSESIALAK